jgi:hypothetical protein
MERFVVTVAELTKEHDNEVAIGVGIPSHPDFLLHFRELASKVVKMRGPDLQVGEFVVHVKDNSIILTNRLTKLRSIWHIEDGVPYYMKPLGL